MNETITKLLAKESLDEQDLKVLLPHVSLPQVAQRLGLSPSPVVAPVETVVEIPPLSGEAKAAKKIIEERNNPEPKKRTKKVTK